MVEVGQQDCGKNTGGNFQFSLHLTHSQIRASTHNSTQLAKTQLDVYLLKSLNFKNRGQAKGKQKWSKKETGTTDMNLHNLYVCTYRSNGTFLKH